MRTSLRTTAAAALATFLLGGLSACGDDKKDDADSKPTIFSSAGASEDGSDAEGGGDESSGEEAPAVGASLTKDEITDLIKESSGAITTARVHMEMDIDTAGQKVRVVADGDMQTKPLAQSMTMDMGGMTMEMRMVDETMYMKSPMFPGGKWIRVRLDDLGQLGMGALSEGLTNPMAMAEQYSKHITDATYVGEEDVNGAPTRHYRTTIDVQSLVKEMQIPGAGAVELPKTATQDIWIDDEGRTVKMVQDMAPLQTMTMTMSDFGKKVDITAPPAGQVTDMKDAGLGGTAG
jgi:lipoprotein LprA